MKKLLLASLFLLVAFVGKSQFLTQSAEGKGALILPLNGVAVGFDIGKTEIAVGANNYNKALDQNNSRSFRNLFFGANLSAKNSSGIGNLFKSGDIVPEGNFLGFLGFNMNNNQSIINAWNKSDVSKLANMEQKQRKEFVDRYMADVAAYVDAASDEIDDEGFRTSVIPGFINAIKNSSNGLALSQAIKTILKNEDARLKDFVSTFRMLLEPRQKSYAESLSKIDATKAIDSAFNVFVHQQKVKRLTPFLFGGIEARNFSWYTGLNRTALPKSFIDTLYRGGQFGLGVNAQLGSFWLGITYSYIDGDNFSNLTSKEYTLRTTDTAGNQSLISEKKITGYSNKYSKVESNLLNIDFVKEFKLGDTSRLIANAYYRGVVASRDTAYLKNISNFGIGIYFLGNKSKFLGGFYVELPDIDNTVEKAKPENERSIRPPFKKLTFGVTTKFALSSIIGFVNRARKPD